MDFLGKVEIRAGKTKGGTTGVIDKRADRWYEPVRRLDHETHKDLDVAGLGMLEFELLGLSK